MKRDKKEIHNNYCNIMIDKANSSILTVKNITQKQRGIKKSNLNRNQLILALAN